MIRVRQHKEYNRVAISTIPGMWLIIIDDTISYWSSDCNMSDSEWHELFVNTLE